MELIAANERAAEDQALADQPYATDLGSLPFGVPAGAPLDDYLGDPPADVVEYCREKLVMLTK